MIRGPDAPPLAPALTHGPCLKPPDAKSLAGSRSSSEPSGPRWLALLNPRRVGFSAETVELEARGEWSQAPTVVVEDLPLDAEAVGAWGTNGVAPTAVKGEAGAPDRVLIPSPGGRSP